MENKKKKKGFTLIEMVVVIAIIAIIAGIAVPQAFKSINKSKITSDIANAKSIQNAMTQAVGENNLTLVNEDSWKAVPDLKEYISTNPKPKAKTKDVKFYYKYNNDVLHIGVQDDDGTSYIEISPEPVSPYNI